MKKLLALMDKYSINVWGIVILLVATIMLIPFIPGTIATVFGISIYYTPALILSPVLMGIVYAVLASYETPKMSPKKKCAFRTVKLINLVLFYALTIAIVVTAIVKGNINF